jgi:hypothetical protein
VRLRLVACEILYRELCATIARSPHQVDAAFLPKCLHDLGTGMLAQLQAAVDEADQQPGDAVLLGYLLCGTGIAGLRARTKPLVIPRGHDCITLLLGSKERYLDYFNNHPGVYFKTAGWIERGKGLQQSSIQGMGRPLEEFIAKYGEDDGRFLWEQLGNHTRNYSQFTYIEMGIEPDDRFEREAVGDASARGWNFEKVAGDMTLFARLVNADWNPEDFLVVPPGWRVEPAYDEQIVRAVE